MPRRSRLSPDRMLDAAAVEFAAHGFGGARVDRIARRGRVNKAMLYYHFRSKQGLYRALLRRTFSRAADRIRAIAALPIPPAEKIDRLVAGLARFFHEADVFPPIMLREVAEGGAHLDRETLLALVAVPRAVVGIIQEGIDSKAFRPIDPLLAYITILAPLVFYLASGSIRRDMIALNLPHLQPPPEDDLVNHVQEVMRRALAHDPPRGCPS